jgi:hypothetical protein
VDLSRHADLQIERNLTEGILHFEVETPKHGGEPDKLVRVGPCWNASWLGARPRQGCLAQFFEVNFGVRRSGLQRSVPQKIGDELQSRSSLMSQGNPTAAQNMWPRGFDPAPSKGAPNRMSYSVGG